MELTEKALEARREYQREYARKRRADKKYHDEYLKYQRDYRRQHPEKVREWRAAYWIRKGEKLEGGATAE